MSTEMNMAKKAIHDKIQSQIDSVPGLVSRGARVGVPVVRATA